MTAMGEKILNMLEPGRENAKTTEELCEVTGLRKRLVQMEIHDLREAGHLVISLPGVRGYFMPGDREDIAAFERQMRNRAIECFKAVKYARQYLNKEGVQ